MAGREHLIKLDIGPNHSFGIVFGIQVDSTGIGFYQSIAEGRKAMIIVIGMIIAVYLTG